MSSLDFVQAADTTNMQAGGDSILGGATQALTYGLGAAVVSGLHSIYNTGVDVSNKVFGADLERASTADTLTNLDATWGDYYKQHQAPIDAAGFAITSLAPGMLAVKGLKMIQAGSSLGAFSRVLGYASSQESMYLNKALTALSEEGGTVFSQITNAKRAAMLWGTADSALQMAAFETATALTMKASPMLDNEDWKDIGWDVLKTSLTGGVLGGGINALWSNAIIKKAGTAVDKALRPYDVLRNAGNINQSFGDSAFGIADAVLALPDAGMGASITLNHGRKDLQSVLDITNLQDRTAKASMRLGVQKLEGQLTNVVQNDPTVGSPFASVLVGILKEGLEAGAPKNVIRERLGDYLLNLRSVEHIGGRPLSVAGDVVYLSRNASLTSKSLMTSTRNAGDDVGYRIIGDEDLARRATLGKDAANLEDAWQAGYDVALDPSTKKLFINNQSTIYQKLDSLDANSAPMFLNTVTKMTSFDTMPTIADVATNAPGKLGGLSVTSTGVQSGSKTFAFRTDAFKTPVDSVEATARHLWAADEKLIVRGVIDHNDVSVLDALRENPMKAADGLLIQDSATNSTVAFSDIHDFSTYVFEQKKRLAQEMLTVNEGMDLRKLAYQLNVDTSWLQKGVETGFDAKPMYNNAGWIQPLERYNARENLLLRYNRTDGPVEASNFPQAIAAYQTRLNEARSAVQDASKVVLGDTHDLLLPVQADMAMHASTDTVGATLFGSSNASYFDKIRSWAQYTGQIVGNAVNERVSEVLTRLQSPAAKLLSNPNAAAEVGAAVTQARTTTGNWALWQDFSTGEYRMVDLESFKGVRYKGAPVAFKQQIPLSEDAGKFIAMHHELHGERIDQQNVLAKSQGVSTLWDKDKLYFPPVDTQRVPFFAFVKQNDGTIFGTGDTAMITARSAAELQALASQVEQQGFQVIYKKGTEAFHKAKGDYDFARTMNEPVLDSTLRTKGLLGNYLPTLTPQAVVEDFVQYTQRAETKLVRDAVSVNYAQSFAELQDLSERYTGAQTSKFEGLSKLLQRNITDPFGDVMKLALNVSKQGEFRLWHQANEFVDALGTTAFRNIEKAVISARGGQITWEEANTQLQKFGLGAHFTDAEVFQIAQTAPDRNLIKTTLQKANMLLANGMLRLDFANSLLNIVSTPILLGTEVSSLRNSIKNDPELLRLFNSNLTETVPGTALQIPSTTRLIMNAVAALAGPDKVGLMERFKAIGTVKGQVAMFHQMIDDLSLMPGMVPSKYAATVDAWVEKGAQLTGSNLAEEYTRFVTSHVMYQITEPVVQAGRMTVQEQNAYMSIFTNRVQGNYIASQRPILFQGTLGSAVGLFQTYQFNLFQQLFRHIENKDLKTLAVMGGLQGSLFGLNGLPMFDAINTHLVGNASINEGHKDAYSFAVQAAGKEVGDWMMYGTASAFPLFSGQMPALYTRGDLNPRSTFVIPTSPMDVPAVSATIKVVKTLVGMGEQVASGSGLTNALLFGLEHNGVNRPLAGLAQVMKGSVTTSKGDLISASADWNSISTAARLLGAKPMDESIAMNTLYRSRAYQAVDKERIDLLGGVIKDKLRNGQSITQPEWIDFQGKYAAAGGNIQGFTQAMHRWDKAANTSVVNEVMRHTSLPAGQRMIEVLGGDPLRDFNNATQAPTE